MCEVRDVDALVILAAQEHLEQTGWKDVTFVGRGEPVPRHSTVLHFAAVCPLCPDLNRLLWEIEAEKGSHFTVLMRPMERPGRPGYDRLSLGGV